jgi:hypothetical protein
MKDSEANCGDREVTELGVEKEEGAAPVARASAMVKRGLGGGDGGFGSGAMPRCEKPRRLIP